METEGGVAPETEADVHDRYEALGVPAQTVVREIARAMAFDREEYEQRVTSDVVATARDAMFASQLSVYVGTRAEFDEWVAAHPTVESVVFGSDAADNVVWHVAPFADTVVAATFQNEREAAVATLRRQAYGRLYRELFY